MPIFDWTRLNQDVLYTNDMVDKMFNNILSTDLKIVGKNAGIIPKLVLIIMDLQRQINDFENKYQNTTK